MKHAKLSASAAHRWMECPGSVELSARVSDTGSAAAAEGTLAHTMASMILAGQRWDRWPKGAEFHFDPLVVTVTEEMREGVAFYVDHINSTRKKGDEDFIEVDLTPALSKLHPDIGGTADHVRWRAKEGHLFVTDFKYGAGVVVEPEENKQLMMYALGALLTIDRPARTVTVVIVQPRIEHEDGRVREWAFHAAELLDFAHDVEKAAERCEDPNAPLVPGAAQCRWCPAKHICLELEKKMHSLVAVEFKELTPYDPAALAKTLDMIPLVEARIKAIREFAYAEAERGNPPPGYKLVAKRGVRKWINDEAVVSWAESKAIDPYLDPKLKSPAQMEKGLTKEQKAELANYAETVSSGHTLASDDDNRPAVHKALAEEFTVIEEMKK